VSRVWSSKMIEFGHARVILNNYRLIPLYHR
jgi:hypothetical protein